MNHEPNQTPEPQGTPVKIKFRLEGEGEGEGETALRSKETTSPSTTSSEAHIADWEPASAPDVVSDLDIPVEEVTTLRYGNGNPSPRPSPYQLSPLSGSTTELNAKQNPHRLHNRKLPNLPVIHEKPEHRVILYLKAEGHSNREVAAITGYNETWISQVVRQPWAQDRIVQILHEAGGDAVRQLLVGEAVASVQRLVTERDNELARPAERISAAEKLLDRLYGKPNQPITVGDQNQSQLTDEELERIIKQDSGGTRTASST